MAAPDRPRGEVRVLLQLTVAPPTYEWLYRGIELIPLVAAIARMIAGWACRRLRQWIRDDHVAVISTYPLASQALGQLKADGHIRAPLVTFLTDFSVHPLWISPTVDLHLCSGRLAGARRAVPSVGVGRRPALGTRPADGRRADPVIIAIFAGLASALFYALCSVLQHRAAGQVPVRGAFSPALMLDLVRHPVWLLGTVSDGAGLAMQALALGFGPVALVQPLLVTGLLFAVVLTAMLAHRRPYPSEMVGAALCVTGLAAFLFAAQPADGVSTLPWRHAVAPGAAGLLAAAACVLAARVLRPPLPGVLLAAATGVLFGLSAALVKVCVAELPDVLALVSSWPLYALIVVGGAGYVLSQNAFQTGNLAAPLATLTVVDPIVSVAVGAAVLHESLTLDGIQAYMAGIALVVMTAGVAVLARHAAVVRATPATQT